MKDTISTQKEIEVLDEEVQVLGDLKKLETPFEKLEQEQEDEA